MTVLAALATCAHFAVSPVQAMIEAHPEPQCLDEIAAPDWHKLPVALWEPCHGWLVIVNHMEPHLTETAYCAPRRPDPVALWAALEQAGGMWATGSSVAAIIVNPRRPGGGVLPIWETCGCGHAHEPQDSTPPASPVPLPAGAWMLMSGLAALAMVRRRHAPRKTQARHGTPEPPPRKPPMTSEITPETALETAGNARSLLRLLFDDTEAPQETAQQVDNLATAYLALAEENERLRLLLEEAATDITGYVEQDYPEATRAQYPSIENKWRRDMALVWKIREALAAYRATEEQSHE